jgi:7,8-dihydroneopterin aldolase/epimerase/oxygenase
METLHQPPMDIVYVHDLRVETVIGVYDWERQVRQTVVIDIDMMADISAAAKTDRIEDALNYKAVAKRLIAFVSSSNFYLVETLAEHVATLVMSEFRVPWVRLRINKEGAVRGAKGVGVIIERRIETTHD